VRFLVIPVVAGVGDRSGGYGAGTGRLLGERAVLAFAIREDQLLEGENIMASGVAQKMWRVGAMTLTNLQELRYKSSAGR